MAGAVSWLFYFKAIQVGTVSKVAPVDKLSVVLVALFAVAFLGEPETMSVLHASPGLEDVWQMHFSLLSGQEYTVPGLFIANGIDDPLRLRRGATRALP